MAALAVTRDLVDGEVFAREGDREPTIFAVVDGVLVTWITGPEGVPRPIHVVRPGRWVGSRPALVDRPRRATLTASGPTRLVVLQGPEWQRLLGTELELWRWLAQVAWGSVDLALEIIGDLLADGAMQRVAGRLLALTVSTDGRADIPLTQRELALLAGVSRNTANRVLGMLAKRRVIERGYRRLTILDRKALVRIVAQSAAG